MNDQHEHKETEPLVNIGGAGKTGVAMIPKKATTVHPASSGGCCGSSNKKEDSKDSDGQCC